MIKKILLALFTFIIPIPAFAQVQCTVNGQIVQCPAFFEAVAPFMAAFYWLSLAIIVLVFVSQWIVYRKAGKHGWAVIIPIYNLFVLLEITNRPAWWIFLMFIPFVNIIIAIIVFNDLAKSFGKGIGFTIGLLFLSFIFLPILAFGKSKYTKIERVVSA